MSFICSQKLIVPVMRKWLELCICQLILGNFVTFWVPTQVPRRGVHQTVGHWAAVTEMKSTSFLHFWSIVERFFFPSTQGAVTKEARDTKTRREFSWVAWLQPDAWVVREAVCGICYCSDREGTCNARKNYQLLKQLFPGPNKLKRHS